MAAGFERTTIRLGTATGYRFAFTEGKAFVSAFARSGTFWIKGYKTGATLATTPVGGATPEPALQAEASAWVVIDALQSWTEGSNDALALTRGYKVRSEPVYTTKTIDIWCEAEGFLVIQSQ